MRRVGNEENYSSESDDDLYTTSVDIRKVRAIIGDCSSVSYVASSSSIVQKQPQTQPCIDRDDDDSDSLSLSETESTCPTKSRKSRQERLKRIEQEKMLELEELLSDPCHEVVLPIQKESKSVLSKKSRLEKCPEVVMDEPSPLTSEHDSVNLDSGEVDVIEPQKGEVDVIEPEKEVNLFVTFCVNQEGGKPGRFMTIGEHEPFDLLRSTFAKELKCNQLDVLIHVNNVDAGPGDTPASMRLDISKLAVVNVFSLKSVVGLNEDLSTNPNFIPVKCIFADGKPRCAYISLLEPFYDARKRIREQLQLPSSINKLVFDSNIIGDEEMPQTVGIEAGDVVEIYLV